MHHWQTFYLVVAHSEDAYLYEEKELRLINLKALGDGRGRGSWVFTPTEEDLPFSLIGLLSIISIRVRVFWVKQ